MPAMKQKTALKYLWAQDSNRPHKPIATAANRQDTEHSRKRQQQRAIGQEMIEIAVMYGHKHYSHGSVCYTLRDRDLKASPYTRFTDSLRGLTVVCDEGQHQLVVITAMWNFECRRRKSWVSGKSER